MRMEDGMGNSIDHQGSSLEGVAETPLDDFMCFALYSANLVYGRAYRELLDELGITYTQWIVIVALSETDHSTVSGLGKRLFLESNTLTPILKKLEVLGYVNRRRDPDDERQVIVSITEQGLRVRREGARRDLVSGAGLSPREFAALQKAVVKLRDNLAAHIREE